MDDYSPNPKSSLASQVPTSNIQNSLNQEASFNDELSLLRSVLLGVEPTQLNQLYERLNNPQLQPEDLSRLLPEAVILRSKQDKQLAEAIVSTVEVAIQASVKQDEKVLSEAFFPILGTATRKAIATALDEMMQSLNQTLEHSLSPASFKWRLEARRTGKSFAEVVLLRTLIYRVEQIFLIHKKAGLLLHHVVLKQVAAQDPDLVAAMLTAIQDFIKDSFQVNKEDTLRSLRFGELTIWIEEGPQAIIAGIIRGTPPQELRQVFQDTITKIHLKLGQELKTFIGDTEPFQSSKPYLENCLAVQYQSASKHNYTYAWALLGIVAIASGIWSFLAIREHIRWQNYIQKLDSQPGIVVINSNRHHGKHFVSGMRDPLATDPHTFIQQTSLNPKTVIGQWQPYFSLEPQILTKRAGKLLQPPATVSLQVDSNGVLAAHGYAPQQWILETHKLWRFVPGITQFQDENLVSSELQELQLAKQQIEQTTLLFLEGESELIDGENNKLLNLVKMFQNLFKTAKYLDKDVQIQIRGHTDNTGTEQKNLLLSQARADKIISYLNSQGINTNKFKIMAVGSQIPFQTELTPESRKLNRRVSFQVLIIDKPK